jgi:hypothetical protein
MVSRYADPVTLAAIRQLVLYYGETGQISDPRTVQALLAIVDGQWRQLPQKLRGLKRGSVEPKAAETLLREALVLLTQ